MQSSYNLIKKESTLNTSKKVIETKYFIKKDDEEPDKEQCLAKDIIRKNYEALGADIIKNSKIEAEKNIENSKIIADEIERKAYEEGYNQGKSNGFEDGYSEGLAKSRLDTENEVRERIDKAEEILKKANKEYKSYLTNKENEILELALNMASIIAKKELELPEGVIPLIENILEDAKGEENIIIRCNNIHLKVIKEKIDYYKKAYAIKGEIFVLEDSLIEPGNIVIDKGTGKCIVGLDIALKMLEESLFK